MSEMSQNSSPSSESASVSTPRQTKSSARFWWWLKPLIVALLMVALGLWLIHWLQPAASVASGRSATALADNVKLTTGGSCNVYQATSTCFGKAKPLCAEDLEMAKIAWKYFQNNYQPTTGLFNAADRYPSTTMWDTGSALAAVVAARELGLVTEKAFDDYIMTMLATLNSLELFNGEAPNKVYHTATGKMVDYNNNPAPNGIGVSVLDLARLIHWLDVLGCAHPKHALAAQEVWLRWKYCRLIKDGQMYGLAREKEEIQVLQEGRLGYEQYAGKIFARHGFDQHISARYDNRFATKTDIYGVPIAYDSRDPRKLGAFNYVVTESYGMDAMENGIDAQNQPLIDNIYEVQKRRWQKTGQVTAVSEDNIDREPWFVYNTIFAAGSPWNAITDTGVDMDKLRSVSTKAAVSLMFLKPDDPYSQVLYDAVKSAYDPERGWYSGIYEKGLGYNKAITGNTNGVILTSLLYKMYGPIGPKSKTVYTPEVLQARKGHCLPGQDTCGTCTRPTN
ncbi:MAG: hypothetical protein RLZZ612_35 [Pseudomonadota bacterium]|jgi:hypothetical protein